MINYWSWWWQVDNERDELARTILTVSVLIIVLLWYKWTLLSTRKGRNNRLPPGPYGLPVLGYLPFLSHNLHEKFTEMAQRYGPIFSMRLGSKLHVVVSSTDLVKVVARDLDHTFANRSPPLTALCITYGGIDAVWSNKTHWRNMRKLLVSHVLSSANLDACQGYRTHEVRKTVSFVYARMGTTVDINKTAFDAELNVVTSMLWGSSDSSDYFDDGFREVVSKIMELLGAPNISDFILMLSWFDLQGRMKDMLKQWEHLDRILDNIIEERIKTNSKKTEDAVKEDGKKDFLQILLELMDQKDASTSFDVVQIKALLSDILTASTDTTSTMLEWVMAEILHNPDVKTKIQAELARVIGMNIVQESHLPKLKYLHAVVKETFRMHPPVPLLIQRCPDESCMVGGYEIPKGTIVYMNVWAIHRDPKNWPDPLQFRPERFLSGKWDYHGNNLKFLPFGSGRRKCPGVLLGEKMLMYVLASLLHSFDWMLPKDEELELSDEFGFVTKKRKPLVAIPFPRFSDTTLYE